MNRDEVPALDDLAKRFLFRRRLGEGAFGAVWEVYDTERGARVALKSLLRTDPNALYRFKREFRALADIIHPNLITLYELLAQGDRLVFTMEFVDGVDFVRWVSKDHGALDVDDGAETRQDGRNAGKNAPIATLREAAFDRDRGASAPPSQGEATAADPSSAAWYEQPTMLSDDLPREPLSDAEIVSKPAPKVRDHHLDEGALREALRQLTAGLMALHAAGKLHRDVKPSNVLVTHDGLVKILDFGLIADLAPDGVAQSMNVVVGTPGYMSPEQAMGYHLTPATDWYSMGAMLYLALTGRPLFEGPPPQVMMHQQRGIVVPPREHNPNVPADLEALCLDLLRKNPADRPTGPAILERLGGVEAPPLASVTSLVPRSTRPDLVGRDAELAKLLMALDETRRGIPSAAIVWGPSGMGKTALLHELVARVRRRWTNAVVLSGRCFPRETVAYKALDALIDELSVFLRELDSSQVRALLPRGAWALGKLFPVLEQVDAIAAASRKAPLLADPQEQRRRAFRAIRELFARLAESRPTVLVIDDLQWGDADSTALLVEMLRAPDPPPLLLIASYRSEVVDEEPLVKLLSEREGVLGHVSVARVPVAELSPNDALDLARAIVGPDRDALARAIASESQGNPFFLEALAQYAAFEGGGTSALETSVQLGDMIRGRVASLPSGARALLEVVSLAGGPIAVSVAQRAAGPDSVDPSTLTALLALHFVRRSAHSDGLLEAYHDRVREAVVSQIDGSQRPRRHETIALALEETGRARAEDLMAHFRAAGRIDRATRYALEGAEAAEKALAFGHAADLYSAAFELTPALDKAYRTRLADALANAGRGAAAAEAYLLAAEGKSAAEALTLRQRAAEQLLVSGHVEEGLRAIREVLDSFGMKIAETPKGALISLIARRARLRVRGLKFRERSPNEVPPDELLRIDACWAISVGLSLVDNIRGADYQARHLLLALQAGEPDRVARALAVEVAYAAASGSSGRARAVEVAQMSLKLAEKTGNPHAIGLATSMAGAGEFLVGNFKEAHELSERGATILRERCTGVAWELDTAEVFVMSSLHRLGRWRALRERLGDVLRDASARGDLYLANQARLDAGWNIDLASDAPDFAEARVEQAFLPSKDRAFDTQHYLRLNAIANIALYAGDARRAYSLIRDAWNDLKSSFTLEIQMVHMDCLDLRARTAIALAATCEDGAERKALIKSASKDASRIEGEKLDWTKGSALLLRAGLATLEGRAEEAKTKLEQAIDTLERADYQVLAAAARRRHGSLIAGSPGVERMAEADALLRREAIRAPSKLTAMFAPGRYPTP